MGLTPSQAKAVEYDQDLILFAGPGSGKTATSVAKGMRILMQSPSHYLCMVTFTAASAAEMRERMHAYAKKHQLPQPGTRLLAGTFHALALRHYNEHAPQKRRLIPGAQRDAMVYSMLGRVDPDDRQEFTRALERYQGAIDQNAVSFDRDDVEHFVHDYHARLEAAGTIDLAMVMRECVTLMRNGVVPLLPVTHIIGDEMQDADQVQLELILIHAENGITSTLVADDDQTIYEWRSALGFGGLQHFAEKTGAKTIALRENFRSRSEVLDPAKILIAHNDPDRIDKQQTAIRGKGGKAGFLVFGGPERQAKHIIAHMTDEHVLGDKVSVLARTNVSLKKLAVHLWEAAIPFLMDGKSLWDEPPIAVLMGVLKAITKEDAGSLQPMLGILPLEGATRRGIERAIGRTPRSFLDGAPPVFEGAQTEVAAILELSQQCARWRRKLEAGEVNIVVPEVAAYVESAYRGHLRERKETEATLRKKLMQCAANFADAEGVLVKLKGTLSQRLNTIARMSDKEGAECDLTLLTMHRSKGLEFDTVFLIDANESDAETMISTEHAERRLFYVGITRAKQQFFAIATGKPSRFIYEAELTCLNPSQAEETGLV